MGLDAESNDLSERIRARAAALPRVETAVPPTPATVLAPPAAPSPAALLQAARVQRFNELVASGLTEEEADAQLKEEAPPTPLVPGPLEPRPLTDAKPKRSSTRKDLDDALRRLTLAEAEIIVLRGIGSVVTDYTERFDAYVDEQDEALTLLAKELVALKTRPITAVAPGGLVGDRIPVPSVIDFEALRARAPEPQYSWPEALPRSSYSFWRSRAGRFISWPVRQVWRGLLWTFRPTE